VIIRTRTLATGVLSYLPGAREVYRRHFFKPGTASAMGCYGIWLKHVSLARQSGMAEMPRTVVELGPGASIGVGLAAMICGAEEYYGLDAVPSMERGGTLALFDELVELFRQRAIPRNAGGFPRYGAGGFPARLLPRAMLDPLLCDDRIRRLRCDVERFVYGVYQGGAIRYAAPWEEKDLGCAGEVDFLISHAVLQHVESMNDIIAGIARLLCPGGYSSHQVSFDSHGITAAWNGHWACPDWAWNLALGKKDFLINRMPHSALLAAIRQSGLEVAADLVREDATGMARGSLHEDWAWLEDSDVVTRDAFVVARSPEEPDTASRAAVN
jgi:hypothetical protein